MGDEGDACLIPAPYYAAFENDMRMVARIVPFAVQMANPIQGPSATELDLAYIEAKSVSFVECKLIPFYISIFGFLSASLCISGALGDRNSEFSSLIMFHFLLLLRAFFTIYPITARIKSQIPPDNESEQSVRGNI